MIVRTYRNEEILKFLFWVWNLRRVYVGSRYSRDEKSRFENFQIIDNDYDIFFSQKLSLDYTERHRRPRKLCTPMSYLADHTRCRGP